jgi:hypothetical protein
MSPGSCVRPCTTGLIEVRCACPLDYRGVVILLDDDHLRGLVDTRRAHLDKVHATGY